MPLSGIRSVDGFGGFSSLFSGETLGDRFGDAETSRVHKGCAEIVQGRMKVRGHVLHLRECVLCGGLMVTIIASKGL